ncbi:Phospholipase A2, membrane associated, partial [Galemys pyrenaicus]
RHGGRKADVAFPGPGQELTPRAEFEGLVRPRGVDSCGHGLGSCAKRQLREMVASPWSEAGEQKYLVTLEGPGRGAEHRPMTAPGSKLERMQPLWALPPERGGCWEGAERRPFFIGALKGSASPALTRRSPRAQGRWDGPCAALTQGQEASRRSHPSPLPHRPLVPPALMLMLCRPGGPLGLHPWGGWRMMNGRIGLLMPLASVAIMAVLMQKVFGSVGSGHTCLIVDTHVAGQCGPQQARRRGPQGRPLGPSAASVPTEPSMRTLLLLAMLMALGLQQADGALWNFWKMVTRATGKEGASSYGFYGCHCGWGGRGSPKDATDRCCVVHDCCYARLIRAGCGTKLLNYEADYRGTTITCARQNHCRKQLCECDKAAALCFARNKRSYNKKYQYYNNKSCTGRTPKCQESFTPPHPTRSFRPSFLGTSPTPWP